MSDSRAAQLQAKVSELESMLEACTRKTPGGPMKGCMSYLIAIAIAFPFFIWAVLYFGKPSFVQRKEGSKTVRSGKKIFGWVLVLTIIAWALLYGYHLWANCSSCSR